MPVERFNTLVSGYVPLPVDNIDTDQIIPARFLKETSREGFGKKLFYDWRYLGNGDPNPDFVLNDPGFSGKILVTGKNFGSGSSREHAAWAIYDYGFRVVVAGSFADIFRGNALNTGLLPVEVGSAFIDTMMKALELSPAPRLKVDLENQRIKLMPDGISEGFEIDAYKKNCLLMGYDDIDYLLSRQKEIEKWEKTNKR